MGRWNARPIFVVAFARGGSSLLLNLLRSHPDACSPRGETHEVFHGKKNEPAPVVWAKRLRYAPVRLAEGYDVFDRHAWQPRPPLREASRRRIDRILYAEKLRARGSTQNRYRTRDREYTREEIARARLVCKNLDGIIFLSEEFARIYPDATFLALVRDGLAVCEGHLRRGFDLVERAGDYDRACRRIARDAHALPNFHVLRYEDLVAEPRASLARIYELAGLDPACVERIRFVAKRVMGSDGTRRLPRGQRGEALLWYDLDEFPKHFATDANENQIRRLSEAQRDTIREICRGSLELFDYA